MSARTAWLLASLVLVLACFHEVVLGGRAFVGMDHAVEFLPTWSFERASILAGELPLWDPRSGAGKPLLAAVYGGALDPVRWAFFPLPCVYGYGLHIVFLHAIAAWGTFRLASRLGARPWIAAFAAVSLGAGGPFRSLGGFENALASAAWVPWAIDAAFAFHRAPSLRAALGAGVLLAFLFHGGMPEYSLGSGALLAVAALLAAMERRSLRPLLLAALMPLVAGALVAGTLLPALELARISTRRSGVAWEQVSAHATHPFELATLLLPGIFGDTAQAPWTLGRIWFDQSYFLPVLYPGAVAVLLVPFAPFRRSRPALALAALFALAVVFALGTRAGLFPLVLALVPKLQIFRYAYKGWAFAAPALAALSALALEALVGQRARATKWLGAVAALGVLAALAGGALVVFKAERVRFADALAAGQAPEAHAIAIAGMEDAARILVARGVTLAAFALALAGAASARSERTRRRRLALVAAAALLDVTLVARRATPLVPPSFYETAPALAPLLRAPLVGDGAPPPRFYPAERAEGLPRVFAREASLAYFEWDRERLRDNLATFYGLQQLHDYNPGRLATLNRLYATIESTPPSRRERLLAALGADFLVSRQKLDHPRLDLAAETSSVPVTRLYRVKDALPRFQLVTEAERYDSHRLALAALAQGVARPDRVLLRKDGAAFEPADFEPLASQPDTSVSVALDAKARAALAPALEPGESVRVVSLAPRRIELALPPMDRDSWLVARDAFEPRWRAEVDGAPAPVQRADFAFRAVKVPRGAKRVVFEYDASLARVAFALQAASALVVLAALAWLGRAPR